MEQMDNPVIHMSLQANAAKQMSHSTKSQPMMESITPRWFLKFLPWVPVEAGIYRVNRIVRPRSAQERINEYGEKLIESNHKRMGDDRVAETFADYEECPKEYMLSLIQTMLRLNTNITDIFNTPIDQKQEQMRLTVEAIKERQEWELVNNSEFGLLHSAAPHMKVSTRSGAPTPDDLDELLGKVWKKPAYFLAHPKAIAAFGRECTRRGVPPVAINICGSPFITWRGVPMIPCDKLMIGNRAHCPTMNGKTNILLMRVGEKEQGVIGLHQPGIPDEKFEPSLSVKFCGIDNRGIASYMFSLYFSIAVLTDDALGVLENVDVGNYYDYQ